MSSQSAGIRDAYCVSLHMVKRLQVRSRSSLCCRRRYSSVSGLVSHSVSGVQTRSRVCNQTPAPTIAPVQVSPQALGTKRHARARGGGGGGGGGGEKFPQNSSARPAVHLLACAAGNIMRSRHHEGGGVRTAVGAVDCQVARPAPRHSGQHSAVTSAHCLSLVNVGATV